MTRSRRTETTNTDSTNSNNSSSTFPSITTATVIDPIDELIIRFTNLNHQLQVQLQQRQEELDTANSIIRRQAEQLDTYYQHQTPIKKGDRVVVLNKYHPELYHKQVIVDQVDGGYAIFFANIRGKQIRTKRALRNLRKV